MLASDDAHALVGTIVAWTPPDSREQCCAQSDGLVVAGVPIGSPWFICCHVYAVLHGHDRVHMQVSKLSNAQVAYLLLRYCLATRFPYWIRNIPPSLIAEGAIRNDATLSHH